MKFLDLFSAPVTALINWVNAQPKEAPSFHRFQNLLPELQGLIANSLDMPTKCAFSWTCRKYYQNSPAFDCFAFADKCAELGYATLLQYSVKAGGPFDEETAKVAARHGQVAILEMYFTRLNVTDNFQLPELAFEAARYGNLTSIQWAKNKAQELTQLTILEEKGMPAGVIIGSAKVALLHRHIGLFLQLLDKYLIYFQAHLKVSLPSVDDTVIERFLSGFSAIEGIAAWLKFKTMPEGERLDFLRSFDLQHLHVQLMGEPFRRLRLREGIQDLKAKCCAEGEFEVLQWAHQKGGELDARMLNLVLGAENNSRSSSLLQCLQYLHRELDYVFPQGQGPSEPPAWATADAVRWMIDHGYVFNSERMLDHFLIRGRSIDLTLLAWMKEQGLQIRFPVFCQHAAVTLPLEQLEKVWEMRCPDFFRFDGQSLSEFAKSLENYLHRMSDEYRAYHTKKMRINLKQIKDKFLWLLDKGFQWGSNRKDYERLVTLLLKHRPQEVVEAWVEKLGMPIPKSFFPAKKVERLAVE